MKPNIIKLSIVNCQLSIITALLLLFTACTGEETGNDTTLAPVQITATAQQLGAATRAPGDIKTKFVPGDEISLYDDSTLPAPIATATLQSDGTWQINLELPLDGSIATIYAAHEHYTDQSITVGFYATASIDNGTLTLGVGPDGTPCWNMTLNFRQQNPVVDIVVFDPKLNNITTRMQQATLTDNYGEETITTSPTDVVMPDQDSYAITDITVRVDNIDYTVTGLNKPLNPGTRYTLAFFCNPVASTATLTETGLTWEDGGETIAVDGYDYVISNAKELKDFMNDSKEIGMGRKAIQVKDIDWPEGETWMPVGIFTSPFTGVYNGNGYIINGLKIGANGDYAGMFGYTRDAVLVGIHLREATTTTGTYIGLLVGHAFENIISLCSTQGIIGNDGTRIGGLVGHAKDTHITRCYTNVTITSNQSAKAGGLVGASSSSVFVACGANANIDVNTYQHIAGGGLVGEIYKSTIFFSYATGHVNISGEGDNRQIGGLVGSNYESDISYSYATANATGPSEGTDNYTGSLMGWNNSSTITSCHATGKANGITAGDSGYKIVGKDIGNSDVNSNEFDRQATIQPNTPVTSDPIRTILRKPDGTGYDITPQERTFSSDQVWNWTDRITPDINYGYEGETPLP